MIGDKGLPVVKVIYLEFWMTCSSLNPIEMHEVISLYIQCDYRRYLTTTVISSSALMESIL